MGAQRSAGSRSGALRSATRLCHLDEIPDGSACGFDTEGAGHDTVFVVRRGGRVHAWRDACPHHGTALPWRKNAYLSASGEHIVCAAHGALFEPQSGICTLGPCLGEALTPVAVQVDGAGHLHLTHAIEQQETTK